MAQEIDPFKLSSPRIFLVRMVVFLTLCALVVVVLYKQITPARIARAHGRAAPRPHRPHGDFRPGDA